MLPLDLHQQLHLLDECFELRDQGEPSVWVVRCTQKARPAACLLRDVLMRVMDGKAMPYEQLTASWPAD
jgi:hypothetical protein